MSSEALVTLILGIVGLLFLLVSKVSVSPPWISFLSTTGSLIGSFYGLWNVVSLLFKNLTLSSKEKVFLIVGTILSLVSFSFGKYGTMIVFWLPGAIVSFATLRILMNVFNNTTSSVMNPLQTKITQLEEQIEKNKQTSNQ